MKFLIFGLTFLIILITSCSIKEHGVSELTECSLPLLDCSGINFDANTKTVSLFLYNDLPYEIDNVKVSIEGCESSSEANLYIFNEKDFILKNCNLLSRKSKFTEKITVTYTQADNALKHKIEGTVIGK